MKDYRNWLFGAALLLCIGTAILGYHLKRCEKIIPISTETTIDTIYQGYPIHDTVKVSVPIKAPIYLDKQFYIKGKTDTVYLELSSDEITFANYDTLRKDDMFVAIYDEGNCKGIIKRKSVFGGTIPSRTINTNTVTTNNVIVPQPLLSLYGGVGASFDSKFRALDALPTLSLRVGKFLVSGQYGIVENRWNGIVQVKIK